MTKVACYVRVSTQEQSYENQLPAIQDYCKCHWWPEPEVYAENESAWRNGHQRELARLRHEIQNGKRKFDYLVVWSLDRLSRQGIAAILQVINFFEARGCRVISIKESWTAVEGPMRELFIAVAGWAAQFESDRRSERTIAGLDRARANGKKLGRPAGRKDKAKRKRTGYLLRYADRQ